MVEPGLGADLPPAVNLRTYVPGDAPALSALYRQAVRVLGRRAYSEEQVRAWALYPEDLEVFRRELARGLTLCAVAVDAPVAFAQLHPLDHIAYLYCHPAYAGQGLGSALLTRLEMHAAPALRVEASAVARPAFARAGFRVVEEERAVRLGLEFLRFRMEKRLG